MGDVFAAYRLLIKSMKLGRDGVLVGTKLESDAKRAFAKKNGYSITRDFDEKWEFQLQLVPRRRSLSAAAKRALAEAKKGRSSKRKA